MFVTDFIQDFKDKKIEKIRNANGDFVNEKLKELRKEFQKSEILKMI